MSELNIETFRATTMITKAFTPFPGAKGFTIMKAPVGLSRPSPEAPDGSARPDAVQDHVPHLADEVVGQRQVIE